MFNKGIIINKLEGEWRGNKKVITHTDQFPDWIGYKVKFMLAEILPDENMEYRDSVSSSLYNNGSYKDSKIKIYIMCFIRLGTMEGIFIEYSKGNNIPEFIPIAAVKEIITAGGTWDRPEIWSVDDGKTIYAPLNLYWTENTYAGIKNGNKFVQFCKLNTDKNIDWIWGHDTEDKICLYRRTHVEKREDMPTLLSNIKIKHGTLIDLYNAVGKIGIVFGDDLERFLGGFVDFICEDNPQLLEEYIIRSQK